MVPVALLREAEFVVDNGLGGNPNPSGADAVLRAEATSSASDCEWTKGCGTPRTDATADLFRCVRFDLASLSLADMVEADPMLPVRLRDDLEGESTKRKKFLVLLLGDGRLRPSSAMFHSS